MAKISAIKVNVSLAGVAVEDELNSWEQDIEQETVKVDGFSSVGPERVIGNYDYKHSGGGSFDGAAGQGDATIHAMVGDPTTALVFQPTGNAAGADDPNYTANVVLKNYKISAKVGGAVEYSVSTEGAGALSRATA